MKWRLAGSVALLAALTGVAGGQQQGALPDPLSKLDVQPLRQVRLIIDSARMDGLPYNSLRLKAIEGAEKKVDGRIIVRVLRDYYHTMIVSRDALGPKATAEEIETGASLLKARVSPENLAQFRATTGDRSPTRALVYLTDLIDKHDVPMDDAISAFAKLWKDGAGDADFDALWRGIDQAILSGQSPKAALQSQMRNLPSRLSKPPADPDQENPRS